MTIWPHSTSEDSTSKVHSKNNPKQIEQNTLTPLLFLRKGMASQLRLPRGMCCKGKCFFGFHMV